MTADCVTFHDVLAKWKANPLIVKLDVEGTELELVESIDWQQPSARKWFACDAPVFGSQPLRRLVAHTQRREIAVRQRRRDGSRDETRQ